MDFGGPRSIHRFDINPTAEGIRRADIREGIPLADKSADFCLFDPPYYRIAEEKYESWSESLETWLDFLGKALASCFRVLKPGGRIAVITDDYLRSKEFQPLSAYAFRSCLDLAFEPVATIYNTYPNFVVSMSPLEMARCKKARMVVNQTKVVHVFRKPEIAEVWLTENQPLAG